MTKQSQKAGFHADTFASLSVWFIPSEKTRFFAEPVLSDIIRFLAEFIPSEKERFLTPFGMTK